MKHLRRILTILLLQKELFLLEMESVRQILESNQPQQYAGKDSFFGGEAPLTQAIGFVVVLGFGGLFSIFTTLIVYLERLSNKKEITSEGFK